mmetsp:Transcript_6332/g.12239  ORF Transcript_6332/g.12239 Transcript_6332/m.12239 type:complete len:225 (+) Transcript_6332:9284-9958(+)
MGGVAQQMSVDLLAVGGSGSHEADRGFGEEEEDQDAGRLHGPGPRSHCAQVHGHGFVGGPMGLASKHPSGIGVPHRGRDLLGERGEHPRGLQTLDHRRTPPPIPHRSPSDGHQDHQRGAGGNEGRSARQLPVGHPRYARCGKSAGVAPAPVRDVLLALRGPGAPQIRSDWLERAVRVQPIRLVGLHAVPAEPLDGDGPEEGLATHLGDGPVHDQRDPIRRPHHG